MFKGKRFHIGTDEYQGDSIAMEQFRAFTDRYIRFAEKFGKEAAIWGSLTHAKGQTPVKVDDVLMYLWSNGYAKPEDMINPGYDVVSIPDGYVYIVPAAGYYYDYLNAPMLYNEWTPANVGGYTIDENHPQLKGGLFAVWNDHPNNGITVRDIHHRTMAALPVMAAKTWDGSNVTFPLRRVCGRCRQALRGSRCEPPRPSWRAAERCARDGSAVAPGQKLPIKEIGYDYTIEFDLEGAAEDKGTVLFSTPDATVWIADPVTGTMAFSREDKLYHFRHDVRPGEKNHYAIVGTNEGTQLFIDGKLIDNLDRRWFYFKDKTTATPAWPKCAPSCSPSSRPATSRASSPILK